MLGCSTQEPRGAERQGANVLIIEPGNWCKGLDASDLFVQFFTQNFRQLFEDPNRAVHQVVQVAKRAKLLRAGGAKFVLPQVAMKARPHRVEFRLDLRGGGLHRSELSSNRPQVNGARSAGYARALTFG